MIGFESLQSLFLLLSCLALLIHDCLSDSTSPRSTKRSATANPVAVPFAPPSQPPVPPPQRQQQPQTQQPSAQSQPQLQPQPQTQPQQPALSSPKQQQRFQQPATQPHLQVSSLQRVSPLTTPPTTAKPGLISPSHSYRAAINAPVYMGEDLTGSTQPLRASVKPVDPRIVAPSAATQADKATTSPETVFDESGTEVCSYLA
jgi:hypothetical protein